MPVELEVDGQRAVIDPADAWISSGSTTGAPAPWTSERARCAFASASTGSRSTGRTWPSAEAIGERIALFGAGVREPDRDRGVGEHGYRGDAMTRFGLDRQARGSRW